MKKLSSLDWLAYILVIVGSINWGLVGFFQYNLVWSVLGQGTTATQLLYDLVGIAGVYMLLMVSKMAKH